MAREVKDSGIERIGEIPVHWQLAKMNSICAKITDYVASGSFASLAENVQYLDEPDYAMLVRTADVSRKGHVSKPVYINEHAYNFLSNSNLFGGEILLPNIGGVGEAYIVPKLYERMSLAPNAIMVKTRYDDRYYYYFFNCDAGSRALVEISQSTAQAKFNKTDFRQIKGIVPPLAEQQRIADYLDHKCSEIDAVIANTQRTLEEYRELRKAIITKAITKGVRGARDMKDSGSVWFGEIPAEWRMVRLKYMFHIKKDIAGKEGYTVLSITQRGITPKNIESNEGQLAADYSKYQLVEPGNFAMNHMDLLTGWVDISKYDGVTSPDYRVFVLDDEASNKEYYLYMMQMCYFNRIFYGLGQGVSGMGRWRLQADKFLNFYIAVPPAEEQDEIVEALKRQLSEMDALIAAKEQLLTEMESYKKSVIYEYVTGKKEVPACQ